GHFGREEPEFSWEATDKALLLREAAGLAGEPAATEESVPVSRIIGGDTGGVDLYA
ncbi:MAG: hypothetical protein JKY06_07220, partial [Alcanivorax sp.]|nr:hypothetical protein [Alcanivorax sp.]